MKGVDSMCTAIFYKAGGGFFGRTLDLEYTYNETVTLAPRGYPLPFRRRQTLAHHHALIGMATVVEGYPLYYDAMNEQGLCMAALHFPASAVYPKHSIIEPSLVAILSIVIGAVLLSVMLPMAGIISSIL